MFFHKGGLMTATTVMIVVVTSSWWWFLVVSSTALSTLSTTPACRLSEYFCDNGRCVPLNRYCDNIDDCGDSSDEPRYCTRCNRTYYGDVGKTYSIELHRPKEDRLPFVCHLTFKAGGNDLGDIVQLTFDSFTIGRFVSFTRDGCPDGSLQISEGDRPQVGGSWCGSSWGPVIYYSETNSITISLRLLRLSKDQNGYNFDFRMEYKVLRKDDAIVRYGGILPTDSTDDSNALPKNFTHSNKINTTHQHYESSQQTQQASREQNNNLESSLVSASSSAYETHNNNPMPREKQNLFNNNLYHNSTFINYNHTFYKLNNKINNNNNNKINNNDTSSTSEYYLGDLIAGTYCSRIYSDCDRKKCRLQSPNFPGVYPRNLTCYYAVRQHEIPVGKHALITVRQPKGQLVAIRSESALYGNQQQQHQTRELKVWKECDDVQDFVTIYDGYTTRDPVILKFCGGGEPVPESISSGHELLVEFTTSPYGTFLHPQPVQSLHGFQLEVQVKFVDILSPTYVKSKRACEFWIRGTNRGILESPQHSVSPNTTCLYHLQGIDTSISPTHGPFRQVPGRFSPDGQFTSTQYWRRGGVPRYRVWFSLLKFHVTSAIEPQLIEEEACATHLNVWDGMMKMPSYCNDLFCNDKEKVMVKSAVLSPRINSIIGNYPYGPGGSGGGVMLRGTGNSSALLARFCKDRVPRSCDHSMLQNVTRYPRPCYLQESFLSSGDSLTLELRITESTALRPVTFKALYEFVDLYQDGEPFGSGPCSRRFISRTQDSNTLISTRFQAPRDIFLYGRGGNTNLSCVYRFEAQRGERVKITLSRLKTGGRLCKTREDIDQGRFQCFGNTTATVQFYELPWSGDGGTAVPRDCLCADESGIVPFTFISTAHIVELRFNVLWMNSTDDFTTMFFDGSWEFIKKPVCSKNLRKFGASGDIYFRSPSRTPDEVNCENHPLLITPSENKFLYVKISGHILKPLELFREINGTLIAVRPFDMRKRCGTKNRITIYTGVSNRIIVCPYSSSSSSHSEVEAFSEGWTMAKTIQEHPIVADKATLDRLADDPPRSIVIEFLGRESGSYIVNWLELSRRKPLILPQPDPITGEEIEQFCMHRCPELDACINASLWCDGIDHCPSGYDEALTHCSIILQLPIMYLLSGTAIILITICLCCAYAFQKCKRRRRSILQTRLKSLSSDTQIIDEKEVIC